MISEAPDELAAAKPEPYIEVLPAKPDPVNGNVFSFLLATDVADNDSDTEALDALHGFLPNELSTLRTVNRGIDLLIFSQYLCDPKEIWNMDKVPLQYKKRNRRTVEEMEDTNIADDNNGRYKPPHRVPKRRRQ